MRRSEAMDAVEVIEKLASKPTVRVSVIRSIRARRLKPDQTTRPQRNAVIPA